MIIKSPAFFEGLLYFYLPEILHSFTLWRPVFPLHCRRGLGIFNLAFSLSASLWPVIHWEDRGQKSWCQFHFTWEKLSQYSSKPKKERCWCYRYLDVLIDIWPKKKRKCLLEGRFPQSVHPCYGIVLHGELTRHPRLMCIIIFILIINAVSL